MARLVNVYYRLTAKCAAGLYGPNNQIRDLIHAASLARELNARFLAVPVSPHHISIQNPRRLASKPKSLKPLHPEQLFTSHFLYQHAVIADSQSDWVDILPSIDFIILKKQPGIKSRNRMTVTIGSLMAENSYFNRFSLTTGLSQHNQSSVQMIHCGMLDFTSCVLASFAKKRNVIYLGPYGICAHKKNGCPFYKDLALASPLRVPNQLLSNDKTFNRNFQECISIHIRLADRNTTCRMTVNQNGAGGRLKNINCTTFVNSVPEDQLLDSNIFDVLYTGKSTQNKAWHNKTLREAILSMEAAAAQRGKYLYILIPPLPLVYKWLDQNIPRIMSFHALLDSDQSDLSDLESLHFDMAVAAGCSIFVPDPFSSVSETVKIMRGGEMVKEIDLSQGVMIQDMKHSGKGRG